MQKADSPVLAKPFSRLPLSGTFAARAIPTRQAKLKALPTYAHDFTTPEGAILCFEDAYRKHDLEAAVR